MASLAGITLTLVLLTLSPAILGIKVCPAGQTAARPGNCPTIDIHCHMLPLITNCNCDAQCLGVQKCCELSCSIDCADPVFPVHPGECPPQIFFCPMMDSTTPAPECAHDGDCSLPQKCCNKCGQRCVDPWPAKPVPASN